MSESDEAARRRQDSRDRLQEHLSEIDHEDNFPVVLTAYQAAKCAAIVEAAVAGDRSSAMRLRTVAAFLAASAEEAKGVTIRPTAAELWDQLGPLPWPLWSGPDDEDS